MARKPSAGEVLLGGLVIAMIVFVATQVIALPGRSANGKPGRTLTARDSTAIAAQYRAQISNKRPLHDVPAWLAAVHIALLQAAAERDVATLDPVEPPTSDSVQRVIEAARSGSYLASMLNEDRGIVTRWRAWEDPIRVWVQPYSTSRRFSPEFVGPARRGFTAWNEVGLGVTFAMVDDSLDAEVHVLWSDAMPSIGQLGTTFRMTSSLGWLALAQVTLSTSYDVYTVQNTARHEAGHVLGLGHSPDSRDIMAAATEGRQYLITDADRRTVLALYALPPGGIGNRE